MFMYIYYLYRFKRIYLIEVMWKLNKYNKFKGMYSQNYAWCDLTMYIYITNNVLFLKMFFATLCDYYLDNR